MRFANYKVNTGIIRGLPTNCDTSYCECPVFFFSGMELLIAVALATLRRRQSCLFREHARGTAAANQMKIYKSTDNSS